MTNRAVDAIVIGGSAGALEALATLLPALSPVCRAVVAIVVHLPPSRPSLLAEVLGARTALPVKEAEDKEPLVGGTVYVASPDYHLLVERDLTFALSVDDPVHYCRPAIDVLFESAADAYGAGLVGVILSGANKDGAKGLAAIKRGGGLTIVQAPEDALVATMPESAMALTTPDHVVSLQGMASLLDTLSQPMRTGVTS